MSHFLYHKLSQEYIKFSMYHTIYIYIFKNKFVSSINKMKYPEVSEF